MTSAHAKAAGELLAFYLDAGVDVVVGETPVDRLAAGAAEERSPAASPGAAPSPRATEGDGAPRPAATVNTMRAPQRAATFDRRVV